MGERTVFYKGLIMGMVVMAFANFFGNRALSSPRATKLNEIYKVLDNYYIEDYDKEETDDNMYNGLISGVGDPYTNYMNKEELVRFMEQTNGSYAGIGVELNADESTQRIKILSVYENSPAYIAGVRSGDDIMKVNNTFISTKNYSEALLLIRGEKNTTLNLTIYRDAENRSFSVDIIRDIVNRQTVSHKVLNGIVGYIYISGFDRNTLSQFKLAYDTLKGKNIKGMIIDVRNNPGGLLSSVVKITDMLIPQGCIVYTENKQGARNYEYSDKNAIDMPLVVLINGNSASASEVLAGAVRDSGIGVLVGEQSYGKGLVQDLKLLSDGSAIKVTVAKYYTPNGISINGVGITPDYIEPMDMGIRRVIDLKLEEDSQLMKALNVIEQKK